MNIKAMVKKVIAVAVFLFVIVSFVGCGVVKHSVDFNKDYTPRPETKIEVANVTNATGQTFDIDIVAMLTNALIESLRSEELLWTKDHENQAKLSTKCNIFDYKKGDAFKRWLWPGWGATVLTIQCDLMDSNTPIGTVNAKRTVTAGGAYTIGAWESVFKQVAGDVAGDLWERINGKANQ